MPGLDRSLAQPKHPPKLNRPAQGLRDTKGKQESPGSRLHTGILLQPCPAPRVPICGSHPPPPQLQAGNSFFFRGQPAWPLSPAPGAPLDSRLSAGGPGEGCRLHEGPPASAQPGLRALLRAGREPGLRHQSRPPRPGARRASGAGRSLGLRAGATAVRSPGMPRPERGSVRARGGAATRGTRTRPAHSPKQTTASCARAPGAPSSPAAARFSIPGPAARGRRLLPPGSGSGSGSGSGCGSCSGSGCGSGSGLGSGSGCRGCCGPGAGGGSRGVFVRWRCRPVARAGPHRPRRHGPRGGSAAAAREDPRPPLPLRPGSPAAAGLGPGTPGAPMPRGAQPARPRRPRAVPRCAQPARPGAAGGASVGLSVLPPGP